MLREPRSAGSTVTLATCASLGGARARSLCGHAAAAAPSLLVALGLWGPGMEGAVGRRGPLPARPARGAPWTSRGRGCGSTGREDGLGGLCTSRIRGQGVAVQVKHRGLRSGPGPLHTLGRGEPEAAAVGCGGVLREEGWPAPCPVAPQASLGRDVGRACACVTLTRVVSAPELGAVGGGPRNGGGRCGLQQGVF